MANRDQPIGFRPLKILRVTPYEIDATTAFFIDDALNMESDGYPDQAAATDANIIGTSQEYRTSSSSAGIIMVCDHPQQEFVAQADGSDFSGITYMGNNCDITVGTGSSTTGLSAMEIDSSEVTAGAAQFHLIRRAGDTQIGANAWGANVNIIGVFFEHMYNSGGGTGYI
jgi:hypothetical protein